MNKKEALEKIGLIIEQLKQLNDFLEYYGFEEEEQEQEEEQEEEEEEESQNCCGYTYKTIKRTTKIFNTEAQEKNNKNDKCGCCSCIKNNISFYRL